jgi:glycosyltransferase involved in cell wall biosynthesis
MSWILGHLPPPPTVELHIACLCPGTNDYRSALDSGATFHLVPAPARGRALRLFSHDAGWFRPLYAKIKPDIVHGWGTEDSCGLVARRLAPDRHVIGIQGLIAAYLKRVRMNPRYQLIRFTERLTLRSAKTIVGESAYSIREARKLCPGAAAEVIDHPVRSEFLAAMPSDGTSSTALFVGEPTRRKGIFHALDAFASAAPPGWRLELAGKASPAEEAAMLDTAATLGLKDRFHWHQAVDPGRLVELMQRASVFLLPTTIDTGPTALKEALTLGLWPVCYDNSGPGEYLREFQFGTLAKDGDLRDLRSVLHRDLRARAWLSPALRQRIRGMAINRFAPTTIWHQLIELYISTSARANVHTPLR